MPASTTVTTIVRQRPRHDLTQVARTFTFTFIPTPRTSATIICKGVAWDGSYLWFCTSSDNGSTQAAMLIQVDLQTGKVVDRFVTVGLGSSRHVLDICHAPARYNEDGTQLSGDRFFALIEFVSFGSIFELWEMTKKGNAYRRLSSNLPAAVRGIEYNGEHIFVSKAPSAAATADAYDLTGRLIWTQNLSTAGFAGPGIIHDGYYFVEKADPALNSVRLYVATVPRSSSGAKVWVGGLDSADEQAAITYDSVYIYEFESST